MSFSKDFTTSFVKGLGKTVGVVTIFSTVGLLYNFYLFFNQQQNVQNENVQNESVESENVQNDDFDDKRRIEFTESEIKEHDLYYGDLHRSGSLAQQGDQKENVSFKMLFDRIK